MPHGGTQFELFEGVPRDAATALSATLPLHEFAAGAFVTREGTPSRRLFLIEQGALAVWKGEPNTARGVQVARLSPGQCVGEVSVLRPGYSSVSVVATSDARLRELNLSALPTELGVRRTVSFNLAQIVARRLVTTDAALRRTHDEHLQTTRLVGATAAYVNLNLAGLGACMFSLPLADRLLEPALRPLLSIAFIAFFAAAAWRFVRRNHVERSVLGLSPQDWPRQLRIGVTWTIPLLVACAAGRFAVYTYGLPAQRVLDGVRLPSAAVDSGAFLGFGMAAAAIALCAATEFTRCAVQGSLSFFFQTSGLRAEWAAIIAAAVLGAALQVHLGVGFAWLNVGLGLYWGSLFARHRSFFAASVSHALFALVALFVLRIPL